MGWGSDSTLEHLTRHSFSSLAVLASSDHTPSLSFSGQASMVCKTSSEHDGPRQHVLGSP